MIIRKYLLLILIPLINFSYLFSQNIVKKIPGFVLIDTDLGIGKLNDKIKVYRQIGNTNIEIGIVELLRFQDGKSGARIIKEFENYHIELGDRVKCSLVASTENIQINKEGRISQKLSNSTKETQKEKIKQTEINIDEILDINSISPDEKFLDDSELIKESPRTEGSDDSIKLPKIRKKNGYYDFYDQNDFTAISKNDNGVDENNKLPDREISAYLSTPQNIGGYQRKSYFSPNTDFKKLILESDENFEKSNFAEANNTYVNIINGIPVSDPVINSSYIPLLWRAGYTYLLMDDFNESFSCLSTANRLFETYIFPNEAQPTGALAHRFFSLKEQKYYLGNEKEKVYSYFLSSFSALKANNVENAIREARRGLRISQDYPILYLVLGNALYQNGEFDNAKSMYRKALQLNPQITSLDPICKNGFLNKKGIISIFLIPQRKWEIEFDFSDKFYPVVAEKFSQSLDQKQIGRSINNNFKDLVGWIGHEIITFFAPIGIGIAVGNYAKKPETGLITGGISMATTNILFGTSDYLKSTVIVGAFTIDMISIFAEAMSGEKSSSKKDRELFMEEAMEWIGGYEEYIAQLQYFYLIPMRIGVCYIQTSPGDYVLTFNLDNKSVSKYVSVKENNVTNVLLFNKGE
ncbi:tetratricopeptide repeat protein [bacterium]|nr:tetratricopeptide repeat protein [bacterium]